MKVICINNDKAVNLTIGKLYQCEIYDLHENGITVERYQYYLVIDDTKSVHVYHELRFKTLDEVREEKLDQIGI